MTRRRRVRAWILGLGALSLTAGLVGCGTIPTATAASRPREATPVAASPIQWLSEPQDGFAPWATALAQARTGVDVNDYLLTDPAYVRTLIHLAQHGMLVQVLLAANPYHDPQAVEKERQLFAGTRVQIHWASGRFDQPYATDHAKYLVINPGTPHTLAIVGSANGTYSAFAGENAEDDLETTAPALTTALSEVFQADWSGHTAGSVPRQALILSPGAAPALRALLAGTGPVAVVTEELGDVPALYTALAQHGPQARVLVPPQALASAEGRQAAQQLRAAGVQLRTLAPPYVHAKLIITAYDTFVGSQNWSAPSLAQNREVGLVTANGDIQTQALAWFNALWAHAQPIP